MSGAYAKLKHDVLECLPCIRQERASETQYDDHNDAFRGFHASHLSTDNFKQRDSDWSIRESGISEVDIAAVENAMHKGASASGVSGDVKGGISLSMLTSENSGRARQVSFGYNDYDGWGEDELTQEICRLHSVDRHVQSRDL